MTKAKKAFLFIRPYLIIFLCCFTFFFIFQNLFFLGIVPTESMYPTIEGNNTIIVGTRHNKSYEKGDVVIFNKEDIIMVKRIAYVGGDTVEIAGEDVEIPDGFYYMLGDNSAVSYDSRYWNEPLVAEEDILAKMFFPSPNPT